MHIFGLDTLQGNISYYFNDLEKLVRALTHTSYEHECDDLLKGNNEIYEFLGDAILDFAISEMLMKKFPSASEGDLSRLRAFLVNQKFLHTMAQNISLGNYVKLGKGERQNEGNAKPSILASAFEALIAGVYLDSSYPVLYGVVEHLFEDPVELLLSEEMNFKDSKTELQEFTQAEYQQIPKYELLKEAGPAHARQFFIAVKLEDFCLATASASSKKKAEQAAAHKAMLEFKRGGGT